MWLVSKLSLFYVFPLRLGLFSLDSSEVGDPLAPTEEMELQPCAPNTEPHDIWIKFLQERIEVKSPANVRIA